MPHSPHTHQRLSCTRWLSGVVLAGLVSLVGLTGCSLNDLVSKSELPADVSDPSAVQTSAGARAMYNAALLKFADAVGGKAFNENQAGGTTNPGPSYIMVAGLLTDELQFVDDGSEGSFPVSGAAVVDSRTSPDNDFSQDGRSRGAYSKSLFEWMSTVRIAAQEARGALRAYAPDESPALIGHLFAIEGMTEVLMAEVFCSGVPLSTINAESNFTLARGLTSDEVYQQALALFDSAAVYATDSTDIMRFINLGRGRAWLALNDYAAAAHAVTDIPTTYSYDLRFGATRQNVFATSSSSIRWPATVGDEEGENGLSYRSDPRSQTVSSSAPFGYTVQIPAKFIPAGAPSGTNPGTSSIPVANGIEARLIESEAALNMGSPNWLTILNQLRTTCSSTAGCPTPAPAGDGGIANLPPLTDPGTDSARVSLLFAERAHWLFLTGHRQGDLRRLVRQYHRRSDSVYPVGFWGTQNLVRYGTDVNLPLPVEEQDANPSYHGCLNRDA